MEVLQHTLLQALANPGSVSSEEQAALEQAVTEFPYFQLAHTMIAKVKHDQQSPDAYESLGIAAIYAPDRRHLRKVFYEGIHIRWQPNEVDSPADTVTSPEEEMKSPEITPTVEPETVAPQPEITEPEDQVNKPEATGVANPDNEEEAVYRELEQNLRNLRKAKEESRQEEEEDKKKIADDSNAPAERANPEVSSHQQPPSPPYIGHLDTEQPLSAEQIGVHQQKQNELISKFVNSDISTIGRLRPSLVENDAKDQDLSEKSSAYDHSLVTENLAEIMLRQGKKDKALEIYQQLILKNPDKKAYFAAKIEQINQQ